MSFHDDTSRISPPPLDALPEVLGRKHCGDTSTAADRLLRAMPHAFPLFSQWAIEHGFASVETFAERVSVAFHLLTAPGNDGPLDAGEVRDWLVDLRSIVARGNVDMVRTAASRNLSEVAFVGALVAEAVDALERHFRRLLDIAPSHPLTAIPQACDDDAEIVATTLEAGRLIAIIWSE